VELRFEGILTKDEFLNTSRLATRPLANRPLARKKVVITFDLWPVLTAMGVVLVATGIWQMAQMQQANIISLMLGLVLFVFGMKLRAAPQTLWEQNETFREQREGRITERAVEIHTPTGQARLLWTDFVGYGEYEDIVVLFQDPAFGIPFPKRFFRSEAEWNAFTAMVTRKLQVSHQITSIEQPSPLILIILAVAVIAVLLQSQGN
jgi:hypothetical protein